MTKYLVGNLSFMFNYPVIRQLEIKLFLALLDMCGDQ